MDDVSRHALVTGATGFVGSHLVDHLLERGWRVSATVRATSNLQWLDSRVRRVEADLRRPVALPEVDTVFHVAGSIRGDYRAGNWLATKHAVEGARCRRFVHVSSLSATGPGVVDETSPCRPISEYGRTKLEGELEVRKRPDATIVRPPVVYGERDTGLLDLYRTLARGFCPQIGGPKRVSMIHVRDLVEGMVAAAETPGVFFLSEGAYEMSHLMERILAFLGRRAVRVRIPDRVVRFLGGVAESAGISSMFNRDKAAEMTQAAWVCSAEKAARELGWRARIGIEEGMWATLGWYRERGLV